MHKMTLGALGAAGLALMMAVPAWAQQQTPPTRIRGEVTKADGSVLTIKSRDGADLTVKLADNPRVMGIVKASLADIKPNSYIGVTAMPQPDGTQRAIAIHIFLEAQRNVVAARHSPWDLRPGSTMTNANVESTVASVDGQVIKVKYPDGEKTVLVPPGTPIVTYAPGNVSELKPGAKIIIMGATKQADGTFTTPAINVGRDIAPPM
jgi:hypothetical protein